MKKVIDEVDYLVAATAVFELAREIAEDVAEAVVGEEELRSELGPRSGELLGLLGRFEGAGGRSGSAAGGRLERRRRIEIGGGIRVLVWGRERAVAGPVPWPAALVTTCCCSCSRSRSRSLHFSLSLSVSSHSQSHSHSDRVV